MFRQLPTAYKIVSGTAPVTTNGGVTADYVSLKNALKCYIVVELKQAVGHATLLTPTQASAVDGTGAKVLTDNVQLWVNADTAASDTLVVQTAAKNYTVANDVKSKLIVFEIVPHSLDVANSFDCITLVAANSSQATNFISVTYLLEMKYKEDVPPAVITD